MFLHIFGVARGGFPLLQSRNVNSSPAENPPSEWRWLKADLHLHTAEDPYDVIDYTAGELLEHAAGMGFRVLAVTLHGAVMDRPEVFVRAGELGILLIPAAELRIEGADVVLLNLTAQEADGTQSFDDLRRLRARRGASLLTFAPHPFYRMGGSIGERINEYLDCFDAIEHCHFHIPFFNPNAPAKRLALRHALPLLATSDAHRLRFFGEHYSLLGVPSGKVPSIEHVFAAIRAHRIQRVTPIGSILRLVDLMFFVFCIHPALKWLPGNKRQKFPPAPPVVTSQAPPHPRIAA